MLVKISECTNKRDELQNYIQSAEQLITALKDKDNNELKTKIDSIVGMDSIDLLRKMKYLTVNAWADWVAICDAEIDTENLMR